MLSNEQKIRRGFQWLAVILAAIVLVFGLVLTGFDVVDLDLWHVQREDLPTVIAGLLTGAVGLSLACVTLWAAVRALGWLMVRLYRRYQQRPD
jgi:hypothetical protein